MDPSLVGSQISSDAMSEESLVREGAGYDEAFDSGDESKDFSPSSGRETLAQSLDGEDECYAEESEEVEIEVGKEGSWVDSGDAHDEEDGDGDEDDDGEGSSEGASVGPRDNRPFILPTDWAVNKFLPSMSDKIFSELRVRYQIPKHIPIRLPYENKKCYTGRTANVGMYDTMFATELRLSLMALHHQLVDYLGLSVSQIAPNAWRTFIGVEILWGSLSGGNHQLTMDEFFYCYRPYHISSSKGTYHFAVREKDLKLVSDMPDSNWNWKSRFFFVEGTNWVCREEKWATMPRGYFDNTWAFVRELG